jgi:acyl-CoA thioester hydrolase
MTLHRQRVHLRWADIDANFHLRHSVYYDLCAQQRMEALAALGMTMDDMQRAGFGPVLFREECRFAREIRLTDEVYLSLAVRMLSKDHRKFAFVQVFSDAEGTPLATLTVEGAWMNTHTRRIAPPPPLAVDVLDHLPRTEDFSWT